MPKASTSAAAVRAFALSLPGAWEDHPWGESVAKVGKKVFVFMGKAKGIAFGLSVKLPASGFEALELPFTEPTGYGLGKGGWVTASFEPGEKVPVDLLKGWVEESYRAIAPKKLVAELDTKAIRKKR
jgi:predicted DNA-binding protein (MmcQ/YjbR family)